MDPLLLDYLLFLTACAGAFVAGMIDLKTTEIPDEVPLSIFLIALLLHLARVFFFGDTSYLLAAFEVGIFYLVLGYVLFHLGQWGEADALLLTAIGFAIPKHLMFFDGIGYGFHQIYPMIFLINLFLVGAAYSILFAVAYAILNKASFSTFFERLKAKRNEFLLYFFLVFAVALPFFFVEKSTGLHDVLLKRMFFTYLAVLIMLILIEFARWVDASVFARYVRVHDLKPGDVLAEPITAGKKAYNSLLFVGLQPADIRLIRRAYKKGMLSTERYGFVKIKEGVRYGLSFFFALILTWKYGFLLSYFLLS